MRLPGQNFRPRPPSQFHNNGKSPSAPPQNMGNPGSFMSNPMQIQPQMAIPNNSSNPQFAPMQPLPFQMSNAANSQQKGPFLAQNGVNPPQFLNNQNVCFGGFPNPMQNMNQLQQLQQMAMMANLAQVTGGVPMFPNQMSQNMGLQNPAFAMNQQFQGQLQMLIASQQFQGQSQLMNMSNQMAIAAQQWRGQLPQMNSLGIVQQSQPQILNAPISANSQVSQGMVPQNSNFAMNGHLGFVNANGAVQQSMNGLSNQMPNTTQQLQVQLPMMNSFGFAQQPQAQTSNAPASPNTQVSQGMAPQNPNFAMNAHLGLVNGNGAVQQSMNGLSNQMPNMMNSFGFVQQPQGQTSNAPASPNTQVNPGFVARFNNSNGNRKNSYNSNFSRNQKHGAKSMKSHFGKRKLLPLDTILEEGLNQKHGANSVKPEKEKRRPLLVTYSEQEIRRWREERRKNYPSKENVEKKMTRNTAESEDNSCAAKLRRQQLKEILAKQAELGIEVAEIPSSYLSDSEKPVDGRAYKGRLGRKERYQNKFNKRGRFKRKKGRFENSDSSNTAREPSLLQKLLSSDIRRDKRHLLQVFRFMTMNSFFKDWPEKPLRFPQVLLKERGGEIEAAEEKYDAMDVKVESLSNESDADEDDDGEFTGAVCDVQENESEEPLGLINRPAA